MREWRDPTHNTPTTRFSNTSRIAKGKNPTYPTSTPPPPWERPSAGPVVARRGVRCDTTSPAVSARPKEVAPSRLLWPPVAENFKCGGCRRANTRACRGWPTSRLRYLQSKQCTVSAMRSACQPSNGSTRAFSRLFSALRRKKSRHRLSNG